MLADTCNYTPAGRANQAPWRLNGGSGRKVDSGCRQETSGSAAIMSNNRLAEAGIAAAKQVTIGKKGYLAALP
jgi:hypothetical protein